MSSDTARPPRRADPAAADHLLREERLVNGATSPDLGGEGRDPATNSPGNTACPEDFVLGERGMAFGSADDRIYCPQPQLPAYASGDSISTSRMVKYVYKQVTYRLSFGTSHFLR
jgi:hypothetical protein